MLLPTELFDEVLSQVLPKQPSATTQEGIPSGGGQRRESRVAMASRLTVIPFAPGAEGLAGYDFPKSSSGAPQLPLSNPMTVPIRDLSRGGVRFLMRTRFPLDTPFVLLLPRLALPNAMAIECAVTYWQPVQRDLFAIGAQFLRILDGFVSSDRKPTVVLPGFEESPTQSLPIRLAV